jgi:hypothetical protein
VNRKASASEDRSESRQIADAGPRTVLHEQQTRDVEADRDEGERQPAAATVKTILEFAEAMNVQGQAEAFDGETEPWRRGGRRGWDHGGRSDASYCKLEEDATQP